MKKFVLTVLFTSLMFNASEAFAVHKLDFFALPESARKTASRIKTQWEEIYGKVLHQLQDKVLRAGGFEGAVVFNAFILPTINQTLGNTTNSFFSQMESGSFNSETLKNDALKSLNQEKSKYASELTNLIGGFGDASQSLYSATELLKDYDETKLKAQQEKERLIRVQLLENETQLKNKSKMSDEDVKELEENSAELKKQLESLKFEQKEEDPKRKELAAKVDKHSKEVSEYQKKITDLTSEDVVKDLAVSELNKFFTIKDEEADEAENEDLYSDKVGDFFLAKYAYANTETIEKAEKNRNKAYYEATQNVFRTSVLSTGSNLVVEKKAESYMSENEKVDGLFASMTLRVGADIQNIRLATDYANLQLAELRYKSMQDIKSWKDKYKLKDYDKDVTTLNLDYYNLTSKEINQGFFGDALSKGKDMVGKAIDKWKGL